MGEFSRSGGQLPNDQAAREEHLEEVREDIQHEVRADEVSKRTPGRPWWRFWAKDRAGG